MYFPHWNVKDLIWFLSLIWEDSCLQMCGIFCVEYIPCVWHIWILPRWIKIMNKTIHPLLPKRKGGNEFEGSEKNTANGQQWEKLHTQGRKGDTGDEAEWEKGGKWTAGGRANTGTMQQLCREVKIWTGALSLTYSSMTLGRFLNFPLSIYIKKEGIY